MLVPSRADLLNFHTKIIVKLHQLYLLNLVHDVMAAVAKAPVCQNCNFWGPWIRILLRESKTFFFMHNFFLNFSFFLLSIALSYVYLGGCSQTTWTPKREGEYLIPGVAKSQLIVACAHLG